MIDLSEYEGTAVLNIWFQSNYPIGSLRILEKEHKIITDKDGNFIDELFFVTTGCFRDINDQHPATMNIARGKQSEYPKHMQRFYAEDVTTSSYGRCIGLLKATNKTATKESMVRATAWAVEPKPELDAALQSIPVHKATTPDDNLWREQYCATGSRMKFKEGISKTTQKPFKGYVCECGMGCSPVWASQTSNGNWYFKDAVNG